MLKFRDLQAPSLAPATTPAPPRLPIRYWILLEREGSHTSLAFAHAAQVDVRFFRGDFVGVEEHLARFSDFLEAADFRQFPGERAMARVSQALARGP